MQEPHFACLLQLLSAVRGSAWCPEKAGLRCGSVGGAQRGRSLQAALERQLHPAPLVLTEKNNVEEGQCLLTICSVLAFA